MLDVRTMYKKKELSIPGAIGSKGVLLGVLFGVLLGGSLVAPWCIVVVGRDLFLLLSLG